MRLTLFKWMLFFSLLMLACGKPREAPLVVFAAVSTTDPLTTVGAAFERKSGAHVQLSFGASSELARAIASGAHADIFLSADAAKMDDLEKRGLLLAGSRRELFGNTLVVIAPKGSTLEVRGASDLVRASKIATADPDSVPLGIYARGWLTKQGVWETIRTQIVPTLDAHAALAAVETGAINAGIVYGTDAALSRSTTILYRVPATDAPPIVYPVAILRASTSPQARAFVDALESSEGSAAFLERGFDVRR